MHCFCKSLVAVIGSIVLSLCISNLGRATESTFMPAATTEIQVNVSEDQAIEIALKAYQGADLISIKLYETAYTVKLNTPRGKRYLKIGAMSGRILENYPIDSTGKIIRNLSPTPAM